MANMNDIRNFNNVLNGARLIHSRFGRDEFTRTEYDSLRRNSSRGKCSPLKTLRDYGIIEKTREETFSKKLDNPRSEYRYFNDAKTIALTGEEYRNLSCDAKVSLYAVTNDGKPFRNELIEVDTVQAKRYYYRLNWDKADRYFNDCKSAFSSFVNSKIAGVRSDLEALENIKANLNGDRW